MRIDPDAGIFEEQRVEIFGKVRSVLGHESEIADRAVSGRRRWAGYPLVVVRQNDGGIRAYFNRHGERWRRSNLYLRCKVGVLGSTFFRYQHRGDCY